MTQEEMLQILKQELVPALGCTEQVAIAYAAAKARAVLGAIPDREGCRESGNEDGRTGDGCSTRNHWRQQ